MKLILPLFTFFAFSTLFQNEKSQDILDNISKKLKETTAFYIEFSVNIKNIGTGTDKNEIGKGWVKGDNYYASFGDNTIISNGIKTWTIVKEEKTVYEADIDEDDDIMLNPIKFMTIWESGFKNKYGKEATLNGETIHVIYLYPDNPGNVDYHTVILHISKSTNEFKSVIVSMKDGTMITYRLTKFTSNPAIADSKFLFDKKKYPGYAVVKDSYKVYSAYPLGYAP